MITALRGILGALGLMAAWHSMAPTAYAQDATATTSPPTLGSPSGEPRSVELVIGKSLLFRLPVKAADVIVAAPEIADVVVRSPELIYLMGRTVGGTNMMFLDAEQKVIYSLDVVVNPDLAELQKALKDLFPESAVRATTVQGNVVLSGAVRSARELEDIRILAARFVPAPENLINNLVIRADQQVMLRVRIAEVRRNITKQLGLSGVIGRSPTVQALGAGRITPLTDSGVVGPIGQTNQIRFGLFPGSPFNNAALALDVLESEGLVRTLAEPNLTALSGEGASFLAGGEIPVPAGVDQSGNLVIQFKNFGVSLGFTPTVIESGRINLHVATEVSEVDNTNAITLLGAVIPGFSTRRAETTVEMPSGGALVIGGLLQNNLANTVNGIPGLVDLPVIGALFRSTSFEQNETELIVTVTTYLVRSVDANDLVLPSDGLAPPTDTEMYLFGRLHARYGAPGTEPPTGRLHGPVGFILE